MRAFTRPKSRATHSSEPTPPWISTEGSSAAATPMEAATMAHTTISCFTIGFSSARGVRARDSAGTPAA